MPFPTHVASSNLAYGSGRTTSSVPVPAGVAIGDVVIVTFYVEDSLPTITPPAGFTALTFTTAPQTGGSLVCRLTVFWKRLTAVDAGSYAFTHASAVTELAASAFRGVIGTGTPVEVLGSAVTAPDTAASAPPIVSGTTLGHERMLFWAAALYSSPANTQAPSGFMQAVDGLDLVTGYRGRVAASFGTVGPSVTSGDSAYAVILIGLIPAVVDPYTVGLYPNGPSPIAYYDARFPNGLGVAAPASGTAMAQWNDLSGNNRHLVQATAAKRPLWQAAYASTAGRPAVQFDGTDDGMSLPGAQLPFSNAVTIYVVLQNTSKAASYSAVVGRANQNGTHVDPFWRWVYSVSSSNQHNFRRDTMTIQPATGMTAPESLVRRVVTFTTADGRGYVAGTQVVDGADGNITYPSGATDLLVGMTTTGIENLQGAIERIAIFDGLHDATTRSGMESYFMSQGVRHARVRNGVEVPLLSAVARGGVELPLSVDIP